MSQALATGTPNPGVVGSIPTVRAKKTSNENRVKANGNTHGDK